VLSQAVVLLVSNAPDSSLIFNGTLLASTSSISQSSPTATGHRRRISTGHRAASDRVRRLTSATDFHERTAA
jgi:hypothetical protein